jgi:hypothetical protein
LGWLIGGMPKESVDLRQAPLQRFGIGLGEMVL